MPLISHREFHLTPADNAHEALLMAARSAKRSLHLCIYGFTSGDLADALLTHHQNGLDVGVVCDRSQSSGPTEKALLQRLVDAGVPVTICTSPTGAIMHLKALLVDVKALGPLSNDSLCAYGSFNFSGQSEDVAHPDGAQAQVNSLILDNDATLCEYLWTKYESLEAFGKAHQQWQLQPSAPAAPTGGSQP